MIDEIEGLGQEDHYSLYELDDHWQKEEYRLNHRSPRTGRRLVTWTQVSPSQIENYLKCKRSWYFKSVQRVQEPQKGHQALGTSFHLIMEKVPKGLSWPSKEDTNANPDEWQKAEQMAKVALPLLPTETINTSIKREHGISLHTYEGGPLLRGYVDLGIPPGIGWPAFMIPPSEAIVGDYKTLSDFRYMKTPEELANSIQMMTYAKWAIEEWPSGLVGKTDPLPEHVRLLHLYARTKAPFNRSSIRDASAVVSVAQINSFWNKTLDIVREMQSTAACTNANDVEAGGALNGHCEAYGGCYFRDKCGINKESNIKTLFQIGKKPSPTPQELDNMSGSPILQKILAARAAAQGTTPQSNNTSSDQGQTSPTPANAAASNSTQPIQGPQDPGYRAGGQVAQQTQSGPTPGAPVAAKVTGPISGLLAKIQSTGHGKPKLTGSVAQQLNKETGQNLAEYPGEGFRAQTTASTVGELMKLASGIVPPDAPPREQPVITTPGTPVADPEADPVTTEEGEEDANENQAQPGTSISVATPDVSSTSNLPTPATGTAEVKKRGRPSKEEMQAREAAAQAEFNAKVESAVQARLSVLGSGSGDSSAAVADLQGKLQSAMAELGVLRVSNQAAQASKGQNLAVDDGLTLYVDCMPTKGVECTEFYDWVRPATQAVEESNGVADWRLINYTAKALLATQIRELVKLQGLPKALILPSFAGGADVALEILSPLAKRVIRPLR